MNNIYCIRLMFNNWYWTTVSGFVNYKRMDNLLGTSYWSSRAVMNKKYIFCSSRAMFKPKPAPQFINFHQLRHWKEREEILVWKSILTFVCLLSSPYHFNLTGYLSCHANPLKFQSKALTLDEFVFISLEHAYLMLFASSFKANLNIVSKWQ